MKKLHLYHKIQEYGIKCTMVSLLSGLFDYGKHKLKWNWLVLQKKHKTILNYLTKHYYNNIKTITCEKKDNQKVYSQCIWTAWLQGESNAPKVIQLTIQSMRKHANGHTVIVITDENVDNYVQIPLKIKQKHAEGKMRNAHFADVIRMLVLEKYGGIWLDATMFLHEPIDESAFVSPFYSIGYDSSDKVKYISNNKWIVGIIGGCACSQYLSRISEMLISYWKEHIVPIDYFVFDYLVEILYLNDNSFRTIVDDLKKYRKGFTFELNLVINEPYNENVMKKLFSNNNIYILSYRNTYIEKTETGLLTNYGYLCNQYNV